MSNCYSFFFGVQLWILANRFFHLKNREAVFVWGAHVWELSTIYTGNLSSCDPMIGKIKKISLYFQGLDLAAKPSSKVGLSSSAQVRKRLSRKSPGPELRKTLRSIPPPTNVTGPETVCSPPVHFSPLFSDLWYYHTICMVFQWNHFTSILTHILNFVISIFSRQWRGQVKYSVGCTVTWWLSMTYCNHGFKRSTNIRRRMLKRWVNHVIEFAGIRLN